jgi:hypothetical protein
MVAAQILTLTAAIVGNILSVCHDCWQKTYTQALPTRGSLPSLDAEVDK